MTYSWYRPNSIASKSYCPYSSYYLFARDRLTAARMSCGAQARWPAIESEPAVFTEMLGKLGMPLQWQFAEVFGLDEELLAFIPGPGINRTHTWFSATFSLSPPMAQSPLRSWPPAHRLLFLLLSAGADTVLCPQGGFFKESGFSCEYVRELPLHAHSMIFICELTLMRNLAHRQAAARFLCDSCHHLEMLAGPLRAFTRY